MTIPFNILKLIAFEIRQKHGIEVTPSEISGMVNERLVHVRNRLRDGGYEVLDDELIDLMYEVLLPA